MTHSYVCHDAFIGVAWPTLMFDMTHSQLLLAEPLHSKVCVPWLIHTCDMTHSCVWYDSITVTARRALTLDSLRAMTHSYVWHDSSSVWHDCVWPDSFIWLILMCNMTHSYVWHDYVWHDSFMCVTWLIHMCDMTVWHHSFLCVA